MSRLQPSPELRARILKLDTPHFCDGAPDKVKLFPPMNCYSAQGKMLKMTGTAYTVASDGHLLAVIKGLISAKPGEILLVSSGGSSLAQLGEIFATYAQTKELGGIIVDGICRDVDAISKLSIPFYAKGICASAGGTKKVGKTQVSIQISSIDSQKITITPGDYIVSDVNGIIAFPAAVLDEVLIAAEAVKQKETLILEKIKLGHDLSEFFPNFKEHCNKVGDSQPSSLSFKAS